MSIVKQKLHWRVSYETLLFDTPDGDLDTGQFARWQGKILLRKHPKNNAQWSIFDEKGIDLTGLTEVQIIDEKGGYYDEFVLLDGRNFRIHSTRKKYDGLRYTSNYPQPVKEVDDIEIANIIKDDALWL